MKALLASAALALLVSTTAFAQSGPPAGQLGIGGGNGCNNKQNPACSKSPNAPSGAPMMKHPMMHHHHMMRHHRHMMHHHHRMMHHHHHMMKKK